jgi:2-oxoglutarate dehydrogenase E1 component
VASFDDLGPNSGLVEDLYQRYLDNPASVDDHWRAYFAGETPVATPPPAPNGAAEQPTTAVTPTPPPAPTTPAAPAAPPVRPGPMLLD